MAEIPISMKSYRLTLNFWHRVSNLPDTSLAKKALLENIDLRTNWVKTIEKLINVFNLADKIGNHTKFKNATKAAMENGYREYWKNSLNDPNLSRLLFYKRIKREFKMEGYLDAVGFDQRRVIAKFRCSDHSLEIEKGRHNGTERTNRVCNICKNGQIEDEEHFLLKCNIYHSLKLKYNVEHLNVPLGFFNEIDYNTLGKYLVEAFSQREYIIGTVGMGRGGG